MSGGAGETSGVQRDPHIDDVTGLSRAATLGARDPLFVASLGKGFAVLESFNRAVGPLSIGEIADLLGENRSSVQRSVHTLHRLGYLEQEEGSRRYRPSCRCLQIAEAFLRCDTLVERAWPFLSHCHRSCEETTNLSRLIEDDIILIARLPSPHPVSVKMNLGARAPAFCTAPGRAMLAFRPPEERRALLTSRTLPRFTAHTLVDPARLEERIDQARERGYALQCEELTLGDLSIAAPVLSADGYGIASVNVAVPASRWSAERLEAEIGPLLIETARAISDTSTERVAARSAEQRGAR